MPASSSGERRHLLQQEFAGRAFNHRQVGEADIHGGLQQPGQESRRAGEPVNLGDDKWNLMHASRSQRLVQLRASGPLAALDFRELADNPPIAAVEVVGDGLALSLDPKAALALLASGNPVIRNEAASDTTFQPSSRPVKSAEERSVEMRMALWRHTSEPSPRHVSESAAA
jgi:hypothetical protein